MEFSELIVPFDENQSQYGLGVVNPDGTRINTKVGQALRIAVHSTIPEISYFGYAVIGSLDENPVWKIFLFDERVIDLNKKWADGDEEYDKIWDDRESLTYL